MWQLALCLGLLGGKLVAAQNNFECPDEFEGYYPHDTSCDKYWECKNGVASLETCGNGLAFSDQDPSYTTKNCDYLHSVECGDRTDLEPAISAPNCPRLYGVFPDPDDCAGFFQCRDGLSNRFTCAPGLAFDLDDRVCQWADQVKRCKNDKSEDEESEEFVCPNDVPVGIFSKHGHPADCRQYYVCIAGVPREYGCPLGTVFKIGDTQFDGKCSDPEDVPECVNYYGDLEFDKQELVRAGVDPEAVGAQVATERVRVQRPNRLTNRRTTPRPIEDEYEYEEEEEEEVVRRPPPPPSRNSNSFRNRPSRPRTRDPVTPPAPAPPPAAPRSRSRGQSPLNSIPITRSQTKPTNPPTRPPTTTTTPAPRREVPAIPLSSLIPTDPVPASDAPKNLGEPVKVKAGEDYYYYYYYYDDEEDQDQQGGDEQQ